jgi:hypothetical protein
MSMRLSPGELNKNIVTIQIDKKSVRVHSGPTPHSWISDNGLDTPGAVEAGHFQRNQANYA